MNTFTIILQFYVTFFLYPHSLKCDIINLDEMFLKEISSLVNNESHSLALYPKQCFDILESFSYSASNVTMCSILHARPVKMCEICIDQYERFNDKYKELINTVVNGTSCRSVLTSHDRLDVVLQYYRSISGIWEQGNCNDCFNWTSGKPMLRDEIKTFIKLFNTTMECFVNHYNPENNSTVCEKCMQFYIQLDSYYSTLSKDAIGVDSICMDIVDSMNSTRSIWSKTLNCCKLRRSPEIIFLCSAGLISLLPLIFYLSVRFCGPIRDLPKVLKQTRFKQTILRSVHHRDD